MKTKGTKGFTLIEVMVVLSILAIIAILAYNFFGGTMREATITQAAAKIADDMRVLDDAWNKHYLDNSAEPANVAELVTDGVIKAVPNPPSNGLAASSSGAYAADIATTYNISGSATNDTVMVLDGVTDDVCKEINDRYTDLGSTLPVYADAAAVNAAALKKNIVCFTKTDATENLVLKIVMVN